MLAVKHGAENIPLQTPSKDRFKTAKIALPVRKSPPFVAQTDLLKHDPSLAIVHPHPNEQTPPKIPTSAVNVTARIATPPPQERPNRRRLDWTPVQDSEDGKSNSASEAEDTTTLMSDFGFRAAAIEDSLASSHGTGVGATRMTRIDLVQVPYPAPIVIKASKDSSKAKRAPAAPKMAKSRTKKATKKAKTITELVTSHHRGQNKPESPMAEFLIPTQARTLNIDTIPDDVAEFARESLKRKPGTQKQVPRKRLLLSPASAMKAFNCQETVFGSASQLAQDEPRIDVDLSSDPVSPLQTQATSHGSVTPQVGRGSVRFVTSRNLWGAADRDEDNALLHIETVDLIDEPVARTAFAGKDALLAPELSADVIGIDHGPEAAIQGAHRNTASVDVDNFFSSALAVRRSPGSAIEHSVRQLHTSSRQAHTLTNNQPATESSNRDTSQVAAPVKHWPQKPNYAGMHTGELQTLIKGYGFKSIRSRDKMVDLLDKCWHEKEARRALQEGKQQGEDSQPIVARHTDFISNVHDLSSRPEPKTKKAPKKARVASKTVANDVETVKKPRKPRKAAAETTPSERPKKARAKKVKAAVSEEKIMDIDDIDDDFTSLTTLRAKKDTVGPREGEADSAENVASNAPLLQTGGDDECSTPDGPPNIGQQIHAAILHQSEQAAEVDDWDHVRSPTWHEKILMYDPIVIEDLARWLNAEGLNSVQEDREVTTVEVRDWCEDKGICCMWKGGWRGQAAKG
jgi:hypothetical protein